MFSSLSTLLEAYLVIVVVLPDAAISIMPATKPNNWNERILM